MSSSSSFVSSQNAPHILVMTRTFLPDAGGIEDYVYTRCLESPNRVVVLTASCGGDRKFDSEQPFPVYRWAVFPFTNLGPLGGILKQILYIVWEFIWSIRLYARYRYRSIEWCHGYDFPVLLLLSYLLPIQCFIYLHGNDLLCPLRNPLLKVLFTWTLQRMDGIVCNSNFTADYLKQHFAPQAPIHVINPTIRPEKFDGIQETLLTEQAADIRQAYGIPEQAIVLLSVGRLIPRKGFDTVIKLLPHLLEADIDAHYLICGKGKQQQELETLTSKLHLTHRVHFAGYVPDEKLASYYAACDVFTLLTYFNESAKSIEGFGIVYAEAGYFGKPVVACRIGGVTDIVKENKNGLLVNPNNLDEMIDAILRLCRDEKLRERLGKNGRSLAIRPLSYSFLYPQLEMA
ncbi:MAG: glycosyltransferase family 4 protein [Leptolyngbya sp. SIO3F4]|nr:glycosyltransferase family 4 protein [Leptolyngbya sp. SIO3F4]